MKLIATLLSMSCLTTAGADYIFPDVFQRALGIEYSHIGDNDQALLDFYKEEIADLDLKTLKENPELIYCKAEALSNCIDTEDDIKTFLSNVAQVQCDFEFVVTYAKKDSRLAKAAQLRAELYDAIIESEPKSEEEVFAAFSKFNENQLRKFAPNSMASGLGLRKAVLANIEQSPDVYASFVDFVTILLGEPEIIVGIIDLESVEILGCDDACGLLCQVNHALNSNVSIKIEMEI